MSELPEGMDPTQFEKTSSTDLSPDAGTTPELPAVAAPPSFDHQAREASMHEEVMTRRGAAVPEGYASHADHFKHQMGWTSDPRTGVVGDDPTGDVAIPEVDVTDVPEDASLKIDEPTDAKPDAVAAGDWNDWGQEIDTTGELSDSTRDMIRSKYQVDDSVIDMFMEGRKASVRKSYAKAADVVGGMDNLQGILSWASANYSADQRQAMNDGLLGPQSELILKGLASDYAKANSAAVAKANEPKAQGTKVSGPVNGTDATPFAHQGEMYAAMNDPRFRSDAAYRNIVEKKMNATYQSRGGKFW